jgi:hypothetical protein
MAFFGSFERLAADARVRLAAWNAFHAFTEDTGNVREAGFAAGYGPGTVSDTRYFPCSFTGAPAHPANLKKRKDRKRREAKHLPFVFAYSRSTPVQTPIAVGVFCDALK